MKTLIKGGTVVSEYESQKLDLLVEGEKILQMGENLCAEGARVIDASGKLVFPGFIDAHTHMDLPVCGTVTADDFESGTKAAVLGGTTCIVDFATQEKGETLAEGLAHWHEKADGKSSCDYGFHMAISEWREDVKQELPNMFKEGVTSFKLYMTYSNQVTDKELLEVLLALKPLGGIVGVHCENSGMIDVMQAQTKAKGVTGPEGHPISRPEEAEAEAIYRLLSLAKVADVPVVVVHLSTKKGLEIVRKARKEGQAVYVESCPQYFLLEDEEYSRPDFEGAKYICSPPLRKKADQNALWMAIDRDEIDTISTDHCSFTMEQKRAGLGDFTKIPGGMPGVEERVTLMYTFGVATEWLDAQDLVRYLAANPARLYGMYPQKGALEPGSDADIVLFDPDWEGEITAANRHNAAGYTPYEGWKVKGRVEDVFLRGTHVVKDGQIIAPKQGKYIPRGQNAL